MALKQITVAGRVYRMGAQEIEIERLVRRAHEAKDALDEAREEFAALRDDLIAAASGRRGKSNTVSLGRIDLVAKVRFTQSVSFDASGLADVRALLGDDAFSRIFSRRQTFTAKKALERFLHEPGNVAAKNAIHKAMKVTDASPKLTFDEIEE